MNNKNKQIVLILSTLRSGSTLLKALLANAPDTSHLPEINFQKYLNPNIINKIYDLSPENIIILKRPAWLYEIYSYPRIPPIENVKKIILVRDIHNNISSIQKMIFGKWRNFFQGLTSKFLAEYYWLSITKQLYKINMDDNKNSIIVRYEDLIKEPETITKKLFDFIGSNQKNGVCTYQKPKKFKWKWGSDDGGIRLKRLEVLSNENNHKKNNSLIKIIKTSEEISSLRKKLNYI